MEIVRSVAGDLVEAVTLRDRFEHPASRRTSLCFRIVYRSVERTLTNLEVVRLHQRVEAALVAALGVEIR